jgi:hypothetical protein
MDTEHHVIAELLALKDAPDDVFLDRGAALTPRTILCRGAVARPKSVAA